MSGCDTAIESYENEGEHLCVCVRVRGGRESERARERASERESERERERDRARARARARESERERERARETWHLMAANTTKEAHEIESKRVTAANWSPV